MKEAFRVDSRVGDIDRERRDRERQGRELRAEHRGRVGQRKAERGTLRQCKAQSKHIVRQRTAEWDRE